MTRLFRERIDSVRAEKKSRIVLAVDPPASVPDVMDLAEKTISLVQEHVCAIKMNFHLILPLSGADLAKLNKLAHSYGLQAIADIKLNDIENTNDVALDHLVGRMGFDCVIANPFIGACALENLVKKSRQAGGGVIALVYMSHPGAEEGFGLKLEGNREIYGVFLDRASNADVDGVVVGANKLAIIKEATRDGMPVYSPGVGIQGGDAESAAKSGADYLIVGRSIMESRDPAAAAKELKTRISSAVRD